MNRSKSFIAIAAILILVVAAVIYRAVPQKNSEPLPFDGEAALRDVVTQTSYGPRLPGSEAHVKTVEWISDQVKAAGWQVEIQETERMGHPIKNIIAKRGSGSPWIILGAHYDSRMQADQDPDTSKQNQPVPGANDGAATVAVLTELARKLPADLNKQVWLVFFDAEDQGDLPGWDWILGSRAFVESLTGKPDAVVIIDMIGDANLNIYMERNSNRAITDEIWKTAANAGYEKQFIPQYKFTMLDDHTPFLEKGIPAVDIIDFDYPYWHTTEDTADKLSANSLKAVGETLRLWLISPKNGQ